MRTRTARRSSLVALAAVGALALGGCGTLPPGAASVVDGTTITNSDVNKLADAQCAGITKAVAKSDQGQAQAAARKQVVQQGLSLLMDIELSLQYAKSQGVSPRAAQVAATYAQLAPLIKTLPSKYDDFMTDTFHRWAEARDVLTQIGQAATGKEDTAANADALLNAGYQKRDPWLKTVDIETDPRYGPSDIGWPGGSDPSVSKAVSAFAKAADKQEPDPAFVSALPANQKCG